MSTPDLPPYTRLEFERRMLVDSSRLNKTDFKAFHRQLTDHYLKNGRLRLRRFVNSDELPPTFKLTKKFQRNGHNFEPIVSIYLTESEYESLRDLPCHKLEKTRYYHSHNDHIFSIDFFSGPLSGLVLCETEAESERSLDATQFPDYALQDVTMDPFFSGGALCQSTAGELASQLNARGFGHMLI